MANPKVKREQFDKVIKHIEDDGFSLRKSLSQPDTPSNETFYKWLDSDDELAKRYARACEKRADKIFEDILEIADDSTGDIKTVNDDGEVIEKINYENIQRSKLRVDARKWMLAKMNPKKYSDKTQVDHTSNGEKVNVISLGSGVKPDESTT